MRGKSPGSGKKASVETRVSPTAEILLRLLGEKRFAVCGLRKTTVLVGKKRKLNFLPPDRMKECIIVVFCGQRKGPKSGENGGKFGPNIKAPWGPWIFAQI